MTNDERIREQRARIAKAINLIRPDWPTRQIITIIERDHDHRDSRDMLLALAYAATDPTARTPAIINEGDFAGWHIVAAAHLDGFAPATDRPSLQPPTAAEQCPTHHAYRRDQCAGCRADALAATTSRDTDPDPDQAPDLDRLRALLQQATHHLLATPSQPGSQADTPPTHHHAQQ